MAHQPYPPFSFECVSDIVRMVRGRTVRAEIKLFAKCVYELVGAGLGVSVGEPEGVTPVFADADVESLDACRASLEAAYDEAMVYGAEADAAEEAIDPAMLAMLIQLAITLITKWLEKRKE